MNGENGFEIQNRLFSMLNFCRETMEVYEKEFGDIITETKRVAIQDIKEQLKMEERMTRNGVDLENVCKFLLSIAKPINRMREILNRIVSQQNRMNEISEAVITNEIEKKIYTSNAPVNQKKMNYHTNLTNKVKNQQIKQMEQKKPIVVQVKKSTVHEFKKLRRTKFAKSKNIQAAMVNKSNVNVSIRKSITDEEKVVMFEAKNKNGHGKIEDVIFKKEKKTKNKTFEVNQKRSFLLFDEGKPKVKMKVNE